MDFGAFVNFFGAKDGLVHISQLAANRVQKTSDVVKEGDKVKVKLLGFDDRGKVRLSMKVVDQETGEDLEAKQKGGAASAKRAAPASRQLAANNGTKGGLRAALFLFGSGAAPVSCLRDSLPLRAPALSASGCGMAITL